LPPIAAESRDSRFHKSLPLETEALPEIRLRQRHRLRSPRFRAKRLLPQLYPFVYQTDPLVPILFLW